MLTINQNKIYNKPNFRSGIKVKNCVRGVNFSTIEDSYIIKRAMRDVFKKLQTSDSYLSKIKDILAKYNLIIKDFKQILFPLSLTSFVTLSLIDNDKNLGVTIKEIGKEEENFIIEDESVYKPTEKGRRKYSQKEAIANNLDKKLSELFKYIDTPLLDLRKGFLPPTIKREEEIIEKKDIIPKKTEKAIETVIKPKREYSYETFNTEEEVNKAIELIKRKNILTEFQIIKENNEAGIGRLSPNMVQLINEIDELHSKIVEEYVKQGNKASYNLKQNCPKYALFSRNYALTLKNLNASGLGLTYLTPSAEDLFDKKIKLIYIRNKEGQIIDVLPIKDNTILAMQKKFKPECSKSPSNYISNKNHLSDEEINSKNLNTILRYLKKEFTNILQVLTNEGGTVNTEILASISDVEKIIEEIKQEVSIKKCRPRNISIRSEGSIVLKEIDNTGKKLYWLPANRNHKLPNTSIIMLLDANNKYLDGIAIRDGKVMSNYPKEFSYSPKKIKYFTSNEIEDLNIEGKLKNLIDYFYTGKINFDYKIDELHSFRKKLNNIFSKKD